MYHVTLGGQRTAIGIDVCIVLTTHVLAYTWMCTCSSVYTNMLHVYVTHQLLLMLYIHVHVQCMCLFVSPNQDKIIHCFM